MWRECCADLTIWSGPLSQMVLQSTKYWHLESIADNPWSNMLTGLHSQLKSLVKSNIKDFILVLAVRFMGSYYQHLYFKTIYYDRRVRTGCPSGIIQEVQMNFELRWIYHTAGFKIPTCQIGFKIPTCHVGKRALLRVCLADSSPPPLDLLRWSHTCKLQN